MVFAALLKKKKICYNRTTTTTNTHQSLEKTGSSTLCSENEARSGLQWPLLKDQLCDFCMVPIGFLLTYEVIPFCHIEDLEIFLKVLGKMIYNDSGPLVIIHLTHISLHNTEAYFFLSINVLKWWSVASVNCPLFQKTWYTLNFF